MALEVLFPEDILSKLRGLYVAGAGQGSPDEQRGFVRGLVAIGLSCHVDGVLGHRAPRKPPEEVVLALVSGQIELEP